MKKYVSALYVSALLFCGSGAHAQNSLYDSIPILDAPSQALWTKDKERAIGREAFYKLYRDARTVNDIGVNDYLTSLGATVSAPTQSRVGYRFFVTNALSVNAFAGVGGTIGINAGLWLKTDNEHELAAVLAHEVAHVSRQHVAQTIRGAQDRNVLNLAMLAASALVATTVDSRAGMGMATIAMGNETQNTINDIRAHEKEADRYGRELMRQAGFDTRAMQSFFGKLYMPANAADVPEFLLTHPMPLYRQADADDMATTRHDVAKLKSRDDYWYARAWVMGEVLDAEAFAAQLVSERQASQPTQQRRASYLAEAVFALRENDADLAQTAIASLPATDNLFVLRIVAHVAHKRGKRGTAEKRYQKILKLYPNVLAGVVDYARFLHTEGEATKAKAQLDAILTRSHLPADVYRLYADILADMGDSATSNRFLIDYYLESGQYDRAAAQVAVAKRQLAATNDWRLSATLDEKAKQIERRQAMLAD